MSRLLLVLLTACEHLPLPVPLPGDTLAVVDGRPLRVADFNLALEGRTPIAPRDVLGEVVAEERYAAAARRAGILAEPQVQAALAAAERAVLARIWRDRALASATEGDAVRAWFEERREDLRRPILEARMILFKPNADARDAFSERLRIQARASQAHARLVGGEAFDQVAAELSDDPVTRARGGRLHRLTDQRLAPELFAHLAELPPNRIQPPFEWQGRFYVFELLEKTTPEPTLAAVEGRMRAELTARAGKALAEQVEREIPAEIRLSEEP